MKGYNQQKQNRKVALRTKIYERPQLQLLTNTSESRCQNGSGAINAAEGNTCAEVGGNNKGAALCLPGGDNTIIGQYCTPGTGAWSALPCYAGGVAKPGQDPCNVGVGVQD